MKVRGVQAFILAAIIALASTARAEERLKITATLSSFAAIAGAIGGEYVEVTAIASPRFNPHFIEPRPSDILRLKRADLFLHSGLDLEAWRNPLLNAAGRPEFRSGGSKELALSQGIRLLQVPNRPPSRAAGDIHLFGNPHYWLNPENGLVIAEAVRAKLTADDPAHAADFKSNFDRFKDQLQEKIGAWRSAAAPYQGREFIGYHNEWAYLMDFLGMRMEQFLEPKPGIPPSPQHIEFINQYIREHPIAGIIQASFSTRDAADSIAQRSGTKVLILAQAVGEVDGAGDYISMIDYNVSQILKSFRDAA